MQSAGQRLDGGLDVLEPLAHDGRGPLAHHQLARQRVPLPEPQLRGAQRHVEPVLALRERVRGALPLRDVLGGADDPSRSPLVVPLDDAAVVEHPAPLPVAPEAVLTLVVVPLPAQMTLEAVAHGLVVVGVEAPGELREARLEVALGAQDLRRLRVDDQAIGRRLPDPEAHPGRLEGDLQPALALGEGGLGLLSGRGVHREAGHARGATGGGLHRQLPEGALQLDLEERGRATEGVTHRPRQARPQRAGHQRLHRRPHRGVAHPRRAGPRDVHEVALPVRDPDQRRASIGSPRPLAGLRSLEPWPHPLHGHTEENDADRDLYRGDPDFLWLSEQSTSWDALFTGSRPAGRG